MGCAIARLVHEKQGLELAGAYGRRAHRAGADLGKVIGLSQELGLAVDSDLEDLIRRAKVHVAIHATCSTLDDAWPEISVLLRHGVAVISIAEEMAYPFCYSATIADEMDRVARAQRVAVLGTGINPGFVLDLLVIVLTGVCSQIESITATRTNDLAPYGPTVLAAQGVGLTLDQFERGIRDGAIAGHHGFPASLHMIATAVGWQIQRIEQRREPIVSSVRRETPNVLVKPGHVAGCLHTAVAYSGDDPVITLVHPQQVHPSLEGVATGDVIEIAGTPNVKLSGSPEIPGGQGTAAIAVNMIARVLNAAPGLHTMIDLPVPAAMLGDVRRFVRGTAKELRDG
jgi:4-hydroxy-tetrahydrodipicolinate reductase